MSWTADQVSTVVTLWQAGNRYIDISKKTGLSVGAVAGKLRKMGLTVMARAGGSSAVSIKTQQAMHAAGRKTDYERRS